MQNVRRVLALLLCLCMVIPYVNIPHAHAANGSTNMTLAVDKDTVDVGDTVTVVIRNADVTATVVGIYLEFDKDLLECTDITGVDDDEFLGMYYPGKRGDAWIDVDVGDSVADTNKDGIFSFGVMQTKDTLFYEGIIATLTFTAKAEGTVTFTLNEDTAGADAFRGVAATETLTIKGNEPACEHTETQYERNDNGKAHDIVCLSCGETIKTEDCTEAVHGAEYIDDDVHLTYYWCSVCHFIMKKVEEAHDDLVYDSNGNGTHYVTCMTCGTAIENAVPCSGGTATCEDAAKCEFCGDTYGTAKGHGNNGFRYEHNTGADTHNVICVDCGETVEENVKCTFEEGSHVCKFACGNETDCADKNNDHKCDVCDTKLSECADNNNDHNCDVCKTKLSECADNDNNHKCDVCDTKLSECSGGTATCQKPAVCDKCGKEYGEKNADNHVGEQKTEYVNNGANHTVKVYYSECKHVVSETTADHTYTDGKCVCEKVQTFTLTVHDMSRMIYTYEVQYGTNVLNFLNEQEEIDTEDCVYNDATYKIGIEYFDYWRNLNTGEEVKSSDIMTGDLELNVTVKYIGWYSSDRGENWAYADGESYLRGWQQIDGDWYYFDTVTCYRAEGTTRVPYPTMAINGVTYGPNAEDKAYSESHADSKYTDAETAMFIFGEDGKFQYNTTGIVGNRYAVNGMIPWHYGLVEINGEYYYFIGDVAGGGNIGAEGDTYVKRLNGVEGFKSGDVYNFEDGKLSGISGISDLKYYENSKLMKGLGLIKVGDEYVYVRSTGELATGKYWITTTNGICEKGMYTFDKNGFLQTDVDPSTNGIVDGVYYKNGVPYYAGLIEIDGKVYYVKSDGKLATGKYYITKVDQYKGDLDLKRGDMLVFGEDGVMEPIKNGIYENNGAFYYYEKNHMVKGAGVVQLTDENGVTFYIYIKSNGQLATGKYWPTTRNDLLERGEYDWGTDGRYYPA